MAQRHDITTITFQANARGANAAIEALRQEAERCNLVVTDLKAKLKDGIKMGKSTDELDKIRADLKTADKEAKQWSKAYNELIKGMRVLDQGIKAFNDGTLNQMSAAFQKTLYNAAKLTRTKLAPDSESFREDFKQLTALMDAAQQNFAKLQGDAASMIKTLKEGGKVSVSALREEVSAQKELLSVLAETDKGYKTTQKNVAVLESYLRAMGGDYQFVRQNIQDTQKVSDEMLRNMYAELQKTNAEGKVTKDIMRENARAMKEIRAEQARRVENVLGGDLTKQSEGSIRNAINNAKELLLTYKTGSKEAQALSAQIVNAEEHLKTHGTEAARAAQKQAEAMKLLDDKYKMMQGRMTDLTKLSKSALDETQKFWQAQMDGATKGSRAYKEAERNLKAISAEQEKQATAQLKAAAGKISRKNLTGMSEQEIQASIAAAKQLAASMKPTDAAYKQLQQDIIRAEEHVKQFGLEAERSSQKAAQQMQVMNDRMGKLKSLSAAALEETKRYWQAQMDGATRGSQAYKQAEANVKALTAEQERLNAAQLKTDAKSIYGNKATMSEGAIRKAIEAARQYQQTLAATDPEYKRLTKAILDAEEHIKKYGIEAERAARKEAAAAAEAAKKRKETDKMMADQLKQGKSLSQSALKAQEQYWQRLIDDPKTAATSLKQYQARLEQVKKLQEQMAATSIRTKGKDALTFFRNKNGEMDNASAAQIDEQKKALIAYRDSLPRKTSAKLIAEINSYIEKSGQAAKVAAGEMMKLADAEKLAASIGTKGFSASTSQLQQAKKALVEAQNAAGRGTKRFRELQDAINKVDLELAKTGEIAQSVQAVLDKPKGQSINALKQAVEQGRAALANMDRTTVEGQRRFAELAAKIKEADFELKQLTGTAKGSASAFDKAWSRLKTYITLYMGAAVAIQKITATFGDLMELSDKLGEVRKTTNFSAEEVGKLSDSLKKLDTRTTITGLLDLSVAAGQLGLKTQEDVEGFTIAANKLMVALPEMGKDGATQMMKVALATGEIAKIQDQMNKGLIDGSSAVAVAMEKVGSTIDRLRATSAATAPAITDFVKRVGAVGAQSGITIDQVAALGSTVDALGMRVEMSATALSRMIPAIKNNAFAVAKAIKVAPNELRDLFRAGRGMEAVLKVFEHIKEQNMDADSIESLLGMGGMQEVMKELNQMGARAGIVFAGLSQNVETLKEHLKTAAKAYEENIAIQNEYNKMNETTAAKWERLKNQLEEFFVGDKTQRYLGGIVDSLRAIVDLLTGNVGPALKWITDLLHVFAAYWAVLKLGLGEALFVRAGAGLKALGTGLMGLITNTKDYIRLSRELRTAKLAEAAATTAADKATAAHNVTVIKAQMAQRGLNKEMMANVWMAVAAAIWVAYMKLSEYIKAAKEAAAETGRFNQQIYDEQQALNKLFDPLQKSNLAQDERSKLISEINSKYSKYLGYMLSETSSAIQLADAHALIAKRIREEAYERRIADKERSIQEEHADDVNAAYAKMTERLRGSVLGNADAQALADMLKGIVDSRIGDIKYAYDDSGNIFKARTNYYLDPKIKGAIDNGIERLIVDGKLSRDNVTLIQKAVYKYTVEAKSQHDDIMTQTSNVRSDLRNIQGAIKTDLTNNLSGLVNNIINFAKQQNKPAPVPTPTPGPLVPQPQGGGVLTPFWKQDNGGGGTGWSTPWGGVSQRQTSTIQAAPQGWKPQINEKNIDEVRQFVKSQDDLRGFLRANAESADKQAQATIDAAKSWLVSEEEVDRLRKKVEKADNGGGGGGGGNIWGDKHEPASTDWKNMTAEELVARRKQMKEFVNAIQTDTDVKKVLEEDAALMKAFKGRTADMRSVIEWYNTERLKIQDELHARHLTNTGDWMDPKKSRAAHKQFQNEVKAYLEELDAYYTERNQEIQTARNNEEITEAEAWRRTIKNETEWYNRRAELQKLYGEKGAEVTKEEQDAIFAIIAERTGDSTTFIQQMIGKTIQFAKEIEKTGEKGAAIVHKWRADLGLGWEKDFLKSAKSIGKQMKFIEDTLAKERPYDGITKNLQENLDKMGVLAAQYKRINDELEAQGKEPKYSNQEITAQTYKEMAFFLRQAEDAWSIDINELLKRMAEEGMVATAEEISKSELLKQAVMGQLRKTFEEVQNAVKKEASQIKKDVDILWNDDTRGPGGMSMKSAYDQAIARLGMQQDSVSRANSLIGAGAASENVAARLAMKQIEMQMRMQKAQFDMYRVQANQRMDALKREAAEHRRLAALAEKDNNIVERDLELLKAGNAERDAANVKKSLGLTLAEETKKEEESIANLLKLQEESQNRLYTTLREWADLLASSLQGVFEASHAGDAEYYNELAKLNLTGKGGPGAGTYIVIDDEGTEDATAHYEYLDERQALERQHEIERENAQAEAWRKVMDDINMKLSETITDQLNAMLQNASVDANTQAVISNTEAIAQATAAMQNGNGPSTTNFTNDTNKKVSNSLILDELHESGGAEGEQSMMTLPGVTPGVQWTLTDEQIEAERAQLEQRVQMQTDAAERVRIAQERSFHGVVKTEGDADKQMVKSNKASFAAMTAAANMYGIAYQTMANDNLDTTQKVEMMIVQAAGQAAISMLTASMAASTGETAANAPSWISKTLKELGPIGGPVAVGVFTALIGGLMGLATSKIAKSKSQIAQVTGASASAGRLATGMLTYAEGNVNEFSNPDSLTVGRSYNVDGADGKTYRAKYMGKDAKTHITNGPEFHLVGEKGREAIIDAHTTRNIQLNEPEIWGAIKTLYNGGSLRHTGTRRGRGVRAFAEGNVEEFGDVMADGGGVMAGGVDIAAMTEAMNRQAAVQEALLERLNEPIYARNILYGAEGLPAVLQKLQREAQRHGEKYL